MENNKENRLRVYKAALEYGKRTKWAGFCWWISRAIKNLGMDFMPNPYSDGVESYEELAIYDPKPEEKDGKIWFPYTEEGYEVRFKILETIIEEMER